MSIALKVLEYELKQSLSKVENLSINIDDLEEELEITRNDLTFQQTKVADIKTAIEKLKQTA